jgi:probable HAF family extracellular repeat protein
MHKLGTLGGLWSQGYAINDADQITGTAYTNGDLATHAFLWTHGAMKDLGVIFNFPGAASWGFAINSRGEVVGLSDCLCNVGYHAFVYRNGKMLDLNKLIPPGSGWALIEAFGVNDAGEIVGYGNVKGQEHAFLLTPQ